MDEKLHEIVQEVLAEFPDRAEELWQAFPEGGKTEMNYLLGQILIKYPETRVQLRTIRLIIMDYLGLEAVGIPMGTVGRDPTPDEINEANAKMRALKEEKRARE